MFALRGIAVSLTFFVLVYCFLSALVVVGWRRLERVCATKKGVADLLFSARILPLAAAAVVTFAFVIPSFQLLEPRSTNEGTGELPLALGMAALGLIAYGCYRVIGAQRRTSRVVAGWLEDARAFDAGSDMVALRAGSKAPPLTLVGLGRPRVLVSEAALGLLSDDELQVALRHERAHMRSYDNVKKLAFRFAPYPGMSGLETAWSQAAEMAADDAAVGNVNEAVDLAAALVKLSRLTPVEAAAVCTVGFVTGSLGARVARLLAWDPAMRASGRGVGRWLAIAPLAMMAVCALITYGPVLRLTHEVTEWLVR